MTSNMTKQVMLYHLSADYNLDESMNIQSPVFTITLAVDNEEGFVEFIHNSLGKLAELTIETLDEVTNE